MWSLFKTIFHYELLIAYRHYIDKCNPLWFFIMVIMLFPLALGTAAEQLRIVAPGIIWVTVLLAILMSLDQLFRRDYQQGILAQQYLLSVNPLSIMILAKIVTHWLMVVVPLLLMLPIASFSLHMTRVATTTLMLSLALGTPTLILIGAIGAALTVSLRSSSMLLALMVLPLYIPILIFGASAVALADAGIAVTGQLALLAALLLLTVVLTPWAIAACLRISVS